MTTATIAIAAGSFALAGGSGTYAFWTTGTTTANGATIRSGSAVVAVSQVSAMRTAALGPGTGTTGTFVVTNTGTVPLDMRATTTSTAVTSAAGASSDAVLGELTLRLSAVGTSDDCRTGLGGASARLARFDTGTGYFVLPAGSRATACVEVDLDTDAPQTTAGAVTDFTLTVTGTQVSS